MIMEKGVCEAECGNCWGKSSSLALSGPAGGRSAPYPSPRCAWSTGRRRSSNHSSSQKGIGGLSCSSGLCVLELLWWHCFRRTTRKIPKWDLRPTSCPVSSPCPTPSAFSFSWEEWTSHALLFLACSHLGYIIFPIGLMFLLDAAPFHLNKGGGLCKF